MITGAMDEYSLVGKVKMKLIRADFRELATAKGHHIYGKVNGF